MGIEHLYDQDFYTWTLRQAAILRQLGPESGPAHLDAAHLAEEIEDLGRSQLAKVRSLLGGAITHLIKAAVDEGAPAQRHWRGEVVAFLQQARAAHSPGMRQTLDIDDLFADALEQARADLADRGGPEVPTLTSCPFSLDDLLRKGFDYAAAVEALRTALGAPPRH